MMNSPLVSVIIPTYNRPESLKKAISSVKSQTYTNIEIVIVDDESETEYILDIVDKYGPDLDIKTHRNSENLGVAATRNKGIEIANGKIIAFLDDDDWWKPTKIEKQVATMQSENCAVCYTWLDRVDDEGNITGRCRNTASGMVRQDEIRGGFPGPPAVCVKRGALLDVGGFDETLSILEDAELGIRLVDKYKYACVPEVLVKASASGEPSADEVRKKQQSIQYVLNKHTPFPERFGPNATRLYRSRLYRSLGMSALKAEEYALARRSYFQALKDRPKIETLLYGLVSLGGPFTHRPALLLKRLLLDTKVERSRDEIDENERNNHL